MAQNSRRGRSSSCRRLFRGESAMNCVAYNLHNLVRVKLTGAPSHLSEYFAREFGSAKSDAIGDVDIEVVFTDNLGEVVSQNKHGQIIRRADGSEAFSVYGVCWRFEDLDGPFVIRCETAVNARWAWHMVEQLIKVRLLQRGFAMVHAAAFADQGGACALVGLSHMGKTSILINALRAGCEYMADDFLIVSANGLALAYAPSHIELRNDQLEPRVTTGPLETSQRTRSKNGHRLLHLAWRLPKPIRGVLGSVFPKLARGYVATVNATSLVYADLVHVVPDLRVRNHASLRRAVLLGMHDKNCVELRTLSRNQAMERIVAATAIDFNSMTSAYLNYKYLRGPCDHVEPIIEEFALRMRRTVGSFLATGTDCYELLLPVTPTTEQYKNAVTVITGAERRNGQFGNGSVPHHVEPP